MCCFVRCCYGVRSAKTRPCPSHTEQTELHRRTSYRYTPHPSAVASGTCPSGGRFEYRYELEYDSNLHKKQPAARSEKHRDLRHPPYIEVFMAPLCMSYMYMVLCRLPQAPSVLICGEKHTRNSQRRIIVKYKSSILCVVTARTKSLLLEFVCALNSTNYIYIFTKK